MDRIGRIGHQDHVTGTGDGLRQIGQSFLGPDRDNRLGFGIKGHTEPGLVVAGQRFPETGNTTRIRIPMGARVLDRFDQLLHDMRRGRQIGISHAEIDDIRSRRPRRRLHRVHFSENVWGQPSNAVEVGVHGT